MASGIGYGYVSKISIVVALVCAALLFVQQWHHASAITKLRNADTKPKNTIHVNGVDQCSSYKARVTCYNNNEWKFIYSTNK